MICDNCGQPSRLPKWPPNIDPNPAMVLAVDPGDVHIGLAHFASEQDNPRSQMGWQCALTEELDRETFTQQLLHQLTLERLYDVIVVERFTLYPQIAPALTGKEMLTSELIGMIELLCRQKQILMVKQPAAWQQPTLGALKHLKMKSTAKRTKTGDHALSAELHGWAYLMRTGLTKQSIKSMTDLKEN